MWILFGLVLVAVSLAAVWLTALKRAASPRPGPSPAPQVAASVLTASAHRYRSVAREVEAAMAAAVRDCLAQGVSMRDATTIRAAVLKARERVLAQRS